MKRVMIMRGTSGSGKSYHARLLAGPHGRIVSADNYFIKADGVYHFDPTQLGEAHAACMRWFIGAIDDGCETIVVDNTCMRLYEVAPYSLVARAYGYDVEVYHVICQIDTAVKRGQHSVPRLGVVRQFNSYEPLPSFMGEEKEIIND